jgi:hypothetical protein
MYTYIHVYMYTYIHVYMYTCIHMYIYTYIHIYIYIDMQAQIEEVLYVWQAYLYKLASPEP